MEIFMDDIDKTKEMLIAELISLRRELEVLRRPSLHNLSPEEIMEAELCTTLVKEVPEYLYSIEFINGNIKTTFHSPRCKEITGYSPKEYVENSNLWMEMIHKDDRERVLNFIQELKEPLNCKSIEHRIKHKDGSIRWVVNMTTVHLDEKKSTLRQSGFLIDVTQRREEEARNQQLLNENRHNSLIDDLTGIFNRRGFRELAEQQLKVAARINQPILVFFIDVDKLKQTNDILGHVAGDELLKRLADILKNSFRESDLIARIGGDEFTVLTMETSPETRELLIERLFENIKNENKLLGKYHGLSVSVGVSRYAHHEPETIISLIDRADKDMYTNKKHKNEQMEFTS
jgi:diguanylate cyclase (GGDEF)-like protein/PAS domain S-box-containing protein